MEIITNYNRLSPDKFKNIVPILLLCDEFKIIPKIKEIITKGGKREIIFERYSYNFIDDMNRISSHILGILGISRERFVEAVDAKITLLHQLGIGHGDLHIGNIVFNYDVNSDILDVRLIDFETAYYIVTLSYNEEILDTAYMVLRVDEDKVNHKELAKLWLAYEYQNYRYSLGML